MFEIFKEAMIIAIMVAVIVAFLGIGAEITGYADDVYGYSTTPGITVATGTGYGITADNLRMVTDPRQECWSKCRGQGGLKSECRKKCGIPPEG